MMEPFQQLCANAAAILLALAVLGLVVSGRIWLCWTFGVMTMTAVIANRLVTWWPERFYQPSFWTLKEGVYTILEVGIALELAAVAFMSFPRARKTARIGIFGVMALGVLSAALSPAQSYENWLFFVLPRMQVTSAWCLLVVLGIAYWYRLPLIGWHRMIIVSLLVNAANLLFVLNVTRLLGWTSRPLLIVISSSCDVLLIGWWAVAAWLPVGLKVKAEHPVEGRART